MTDSHEAIINMLNFVEKVLNSLIKILLLRNVIQITEQLKYLLPVCSKFRNCDIYPMQFGYPRPKKVLFWNYRSRETYLESIFEALGRKKKYMSIIYNYVYNVPSQLLP